MCSALYVVFLNNKKVYLLYENLDQLSNINMVLALVLLLLIDIFQLIVLLKSDFNYCNIFALC